MLVGRAADRYALLNHARAAGVIPQAILLEPEGRNTGLAVAAAMAWVEQHQPDAPMLAILPADHWLPDPALWQQTLREAARASADQQRLCLLGATARTPSREFGYMVSQPGAGEGPWRPVVRFVEKPEDPIALLKQGSHWNMGQFLASPACMQQAFAEAAPSLLRAARTALSESQRAYEYILLPPWPGPLGATPFDRAVVESTPCIMVPYSGEWQDLGTLAAWEGVTGLGAPFYAQLPARVDRPWGYFELLEASETTLRKRLTIYPGCRLSRQRHAHRSERWTLIAGTAHIEKNDDIHRLEVGQTIAIPRQCWHRLSNHHENILIIEEIQHGMPDEADIERVEDDYGRL